MKWKTLGAAALLATAILVPDVCFAQRGGARAYMQRMQQMQKMEAQYYQQMIKAEQEAIIREQEARKARLRAIGAGRANVKEVPHSYVNVKSDESPSTRSKSGEKSSKSTTSKRTTGSRTAKSSKDPKGTKSLKSDKDTEEKMDEAAEPKDAKGAKDEQPVAAGKATPAKKAAPSK